MTLTQSTKNLIARISERPFIGATAGRFFNDEIPSRGFRFHTQGLEDQTKAQLLFRTYESAEIRAVQRHLRRDLDVIEVGAGIGVLSCHIRRHIDSGRHLYCIEANPNAAAMIKNNLNLNGLTAGVTVVNAAMAHVAGRVRFVRGTTVIDGRIAEDRCPSEHPLIPAVTLEHLVTQFGLRQYALVCDIEGSEAAIITNDSAAIKNCAQIIMELHHIAYFGRQYDPDDILSSLQLSFSLQTRHGNVCVLNRK